jgi:hypothetical protein
LLLVDSFLPALPGDFVAAGVVFFDSVAVGIHVALEGVSSLLLVGSISLPLSLALDSIMKSTTRINDVLR